MFLVYDCGVSYVSHQAQGSLSNTLICYAMFPQLWFNVGSSSETMTQHWTRVWPAYFPFWTRGWKRWCNPGKASILGCTPKTVWFSCYINLPSLVHCSVGAFASGDPLYNLFIRLQMLYVDQWSDNYDFVTHLWLILIIGRRRWRCNAQLALDWIISLLTWMW